MTVSENAGHFPISEWTGGQAFEQAKPFLSDKRLLARLHPRMLQQGDDKLAWMLVAWE